MCVYNIEVGLATTPNTQIFDIDMMRPPIPDPLIGHERQSRYKLIGSIGVGGNAFVYKYLDMETSPNEVVAIKVSQLHISTHNVLTSSSISPHSQFINLMQSTPLSKYVEYEISNHRYGPKEASLCHLSPETCPRRRLHHPHIIEFKEAFLTEDYIAVVMECATGGDLFSFVKTHTRLSEAGARWFFQQIIAALEYCHKVGVVVRDLKLENCLLHISPDQGLPILKLCDFGFSKGSAVSDPKSSVGTLAYMAPEVLKTSGSYNGQLADLWSAGVMLFVMVFGQYPFDPLNSSSGGPAKTLKVVNAIMSGAWKFPDGGVSISPGCQRLLQRLILVDPSQRMSMADLLKDDWFLIDLPPETRRMNQLCVAAADEADIDPEESQIKKLLAEAMEKQHKFWEASRGAAVIILPSCTRSGRI